MVERLLKNRACAFDLNPLGHAGDEVALDQDALGHIVMRTNRDRCSRWIDKKVTAHDQVAFSLKKRLGRIIEEYISDYLVLVVTAPAATGKMAHQDVGPRHFAAAGIVLLHKHVALDERAL